VLIGILNEIIEMCAKAMEEPQFFYNQKFVNYRGFCSDSKIRYTELVASYLINHFQDFENGFNNKKIQRKSSYNVKHNGEFNPKSNRTEEIIAMKMFNSSNNDQSFAKIGKILNYQIPLKNKQTDKAGKIDLVAYDENVHVLRILELKEQNSNETMLRCVLEAYTYLRIVDKEKLRKDFDLPEKTDIKACPFVFENGVQYDEYKDPKYANLRELMKKLDSTPIFLRATGLCNTRIDTTFTIV
jgi:hypothetical protein